jgi:hypothetical protein
MRRPDVHVALQIHQLTLERLNARTPRTRLELRQTVERDHEKDARTRPVDSSRATKSMTCDGGTPSRRFPQSWITRVHHETDNLAPPCARSLDLGDAPHAELEHALADMPIAGCDLEFGSRG